VKRIVSPAILIACLLAASSVAWAQDCTLWNNGQLAGTYTMSGSGFVDLSKMLPGMGLPSGLIPMTWVGAFTMDPSGGGTGWVSFNAAGNQMNVQLVGKKFSMNGDCSIQESFSMKIKELGITVGPVYRLLVPVTKPDGLELQMIFLGTPPGTPAGPALDLGVAHRISRQY
jgi:hypothetical protein